MNPWQLACAELGLQNKPPQPPTMAEISHEGWPKPGTRQRAVLEHIETHGPQYREVLAGILGCGETVVSVYLADLLHKKILLRHPADSKGLGHRPKSIYRLPWQAGPHNVQVQRHAEGVSDATKG